jgi:hypothetical protein
MSQFSPNDARQRRTIQQLAEQVAVITRPTRSALVALGQGATVWIPRYVNWTDLQGLTDATDPLTLTRDFPIAVLPPGAMGHDVFLVVEETFAEPTATMTTLVASLHAVVGTPEVEQFGGAWSLNVFAGAAFTTQNYQSLAATKGTIDWTQAMTIYARITADAPLGLLNAGRLWCGINVSQPKAFTNRGTGPGGGGDPMAPPTSPGTPGSSGLGEFYGGGIDILPTEGSGGETASF